MNDKDIRMNMQEGRRDEKHPLLQEPGSANGQEFEDHAADGNQSIPSVIWLVMKICCVFYQRPLIGLRRCLMCQIEASRQRMWKIGKRGDMSEYFPHAFDPCGQGYKDAMTNPTTHPREWRGNCKLCCSFWWTTDIRMRRHTDDDIGGRYWNHPGSWLLSVTLLCLGILFAVAEFLFYAYIQRNDPHQLVHVISYFLFLVELSLYPISSLYSKLMVSTRESVPAFSWSVAYSPRFLIKRLQFIDFSRGIPGKVMLFLCFAWPVVLLVHRVLVYEVFCTSWGDAASVPARYVSVIFTFLLMVIWACSQYLMFLCRISFIRQFQLALEFIRLNQTDLDSCRRIVWHAVYDFNCYRRFVYIYMRLMIPFSSWAVTTVLFWQYNYHDTYCTGNLWMIWSQICMFLGISLSSAGGLDVAYMWCYFQQMIFTTEQAPSTRRFWRKMRQHLGFLHGDHGYEVHWTIGLSFVTVVIAVYSSDISGNGTQSELTNSSEAWS